MVMNRAMKDSRVEWIGKVPEEWDVQRLKNILIERKENNKPQKTDNILSLMKDRGVIPYSEKGDIGNKSKTDLTQYKLAYPGDIVLNSMNVIIGSVGLSKYFGAVSPVYYMLRPRLSKDFVEYYNFIFQTEVFQKSLIGYGNGIMEHRMRIPMNNLNNVSLPVPPSYEQKKIATFLDEKVSHIDNIIEDTKKSIENLKLYKQALITERITKGMDPNVDMKDSGVEYIGKIPSHWKFSKFKYLLTSPLKYGANESGVVYDDSKPRYIRITDILEGNKLINSNRQSLDEDAAKEYILKDGDLLFARSGATAGKTYMVNKNTPRSAFAGYLIKADVGDIDVSNYVYYYTLSKSYEEWKNSVVIQATIQNIGAEKYGNMFLPIPPKDEQIDIVEYLNKKIKSIDLILEDKKLLLSEFESYKKSLIYEYVTGKKEVK